MNEEKVHAVSDYIIRAAEREKCFLDAIKLQRLLYIAYAWYLAFHGGKRLFDNAFEAWRYGPVAPAVHRRFRERSQIHYPITSRDLYFSDANELSQALTREEREHLDLVMQVYGELSAFELEAMLQRDQAWRNTRLGLDSEEGCSRRINDLQILEHYRRRVHTNTG